MEHSLLLASSERDVARIVADWREVRESLDRRLPDTDPDRYLAALGARRGEARPHVVVHRRAGKADGLIVGGADGNAVAALVRHLRRLLRHGTVDHVVVRELPEGHLAHRTLRACTPVPPRTDMRRTIRLVPGSYDESMAHHQARTRQNLRRSDRRYLRHFGGDGRLRVYRHPEDVAPFIADAEGITRLTYQHRLGAGIADTPHWRSVLACDAARGRFLAYVLEGGGRPIAYDQGVLDDGVFWWDGSGFLPEHRRIRPGAVLFDCVIEDLCRRDAQWMDLGIGETRQKSVFGTHSWRESTFQLYGPGNRAQAALALDLASSLVRKSAYRLLPASLPGRIKKAWRRALSSSTRGRAGR